MDAIMPEGGLRLESKLLRVTCFGRFVALLGSGSPRNGPGSKHNPGLTENQFRRPIIRPVRGVVVILKTFTSKSETNSPQLAYMHMSRAPSMQLQAGGPLIPHNSPTCICPEHHTCNRACCFSSGRTAATPQLAHIHRSTACGSQRLIGTIY